MNEYTFSDLYVGQKESFKAKMCGTITKKHETTRRVEIRATIRNQNGIKVSSGGSTADGGSMRFII